MKRVKAGDWISSCAFLGFFTALAILTTHISLWAGLVAGVMATVCLLVFLGRVREGYLEAERDERQRSGECLSCGYKLRGNISGICPECGSPVKP